MIKENGINKVSKVQNFWQKLKKANKPIFVIAPMANVTDVAFRAMFAKYGKPDVMWTEFVSADGLCSPGREMLLHDLKFSKKEKPIVAQLFSAHSDKMREACRLVAKLGFDGIDINMGCPDRSVEKQGAGAAMMKNPALAKEVLEAAREGVNDAGKSGKAIPISIKTRIGYNKVDMGWIEFLLEQKLPSLTVHLRTRKEMSDVPAHWDLMKEIVVLRDRISPDTILIGNGDVVSLADAKKKVKESGCDGAMIGRGIFGNPWFFKGKMPADFSPEQRLKVMIEHARLFKKHLGGVKNFAIMKKHFKAYVCGWEGAKELRVRLMESEGLKEVEVLTKTYIFDYIKSKKAL
jgi:nifR3 family TIM-barrel protein